MRARQITYWICEIAPSNGIGMEVASNDCITREPGELRQSVVGTDEQELKRSQLQCIS
jgi:hypothetical protein